MASDEYQDKLSHLLSCGVGELEAEYVAHGVPENDTVREVRQFCAGPLTFCLLLGGTGSGKTVAASEALLNSKGHWANGWAYFSSEAHLVSASDLARLSYFDMEAQRMMGRMERYRWLVLDDLGSELVTDTWRSNLSELMRQRNSAKYKTLITSNLPVDDFKGRYDARVVSRIKGSGVVINAGSHDYRREKSEAA